MCDRISPDAQIGRDVAMGANVVVEAGASIGDGCAVGSHTVIMAGTVLGDGCILGDNAGVRERCRIGRGVVLMGRTAERFKYLKGPTIRRGARVGGGAHLLPGVEIGEEAFVATGSVVTRDVAPRTLVMGVPAKVVRDVPEEQLLENQ